MGPFKGKKKRLRVAWNGDDREVSVILVFEYDWASNS